MGFNNSVIICWGRARAVDPVVTTITLPITFTSKSSTTATLVQDFNDYYLAGVSVDNFNVSQLNFVIGGWSGSTFYTGLIYFIRIGF